MGPSTFRVMFEGDEGARLAATIIELDNPGSMVDQQMRTHQLTLTLPLDSALVFRSHQVSATAVLQTNSNVQGEIYKGDKLRKRASAQGQYAVIMLEGQ